jgi:excisionase family DNA binding protein
METDLKADNRNLLTPKQVAERLHVSRPYVRYLMLSGRLAYVTLPSTSKTRRHRRISEAQLLAFLSTNVNEVNASQGADEAYDSARLPKPTYPDRPRC